MTDVEIYSTTICPYCVAAKQFLDRKGLSYREVLIDTDPQQRTLMLERSGGRRTVPQIFINGAHVGGFDDLVAAERSGRLDGLISG